MYYNIGIVYIVTLRNLIFKNQYQMTDLALLFTTKYKNRVRSIHHNGSSSARQ